MLNKENIMGIIQDHQNEINQYEHSIRRLKDEIEYVNYKLSFLYENKARYEMQARAWGLIEEDGE